jgi:hypothetical protein
MNPNSIEGIRWWIYHELEAAKARDAKDIKQARQKNGRAKLELTLEAAAEEGAIETLNRLLAWLQTSQVGTVGR